MEGMNVLVKKTKEEVSLETEETILDQKVEQVSSEESEPLVLDVDQLDGLAIMADTDNSKLKSNSYFQNIYFSSK